MKSMPFASLHRFALVISLAAPFARPAAAQTLTVDTANGNTPYSLTASATYTTVYVGNTGTGEIDHSAGTLTVGIVNTSDQALFVAYNVGSTGTYDLSGTATLVSTNFTAVGTFGTGVFNQTGGTANFDSGYLDSLAVGSYNGSVGTYNQNAGTVLATDVTVSDYAGSTGTYNLNGGTLTTGAVIGGTAGGTNSTFNFNGGTLQATGSSTSFISGLTTAQIRDGGATIDTNGFNATVSQALVHSNIAGDNAQDGGLTKNGAGTLTLTGANTYTGQTTVNAGTLAFGSGGSLTNNGNFVVQSGATLTLATGSSLTIDSLFIGSTGAGNVTQSGGSVTTTPNTGSYVDVGGFAPGTYKLSGGMITTDQLEAGIFASGTFTMTDGSVIAGAVRVGVGSGGGVGIFNQNGGTITAGPAGTLGDIGVLIARDAGSIGFGAAAVGTYNLNGGTLATPLVAGLGGTSTFNFNGGTLTATASDNPSAASNPTTFFSSLTTAQIRNGGAIIYTNGNDVTIASPLTHSAIDGDNATDGGLTKNASGSLTLTANNTYTGNTVVNAGALYVNNTPAKAGDSGTGSGTVYVNTGAWLGGTGSIGGSVIVGSGGPAPTALRPQLSAGRGTLTPGVNGSGTLTINGSLTLQDGLSMLEMDLNPANTGSDLLKVGGNLSLGGDLQLTLAAGFTPTALETFTLIEVTGTGTTTGTFENTAANGTLYTDASGDEFLLNYHADVDGDLSLNDVTATFLGVPEPSAWALWGVGLAGIGFALRLRRVA